MEPIDLTIVEQYRQTHLRDEAMTKAAELREQNDEQLGFSLKEAQKSLFEMQFQSVTEQLDAPSRKKDLRREIARIKTIQHERALAATKADS